MYKYNGYNRMNCDHTQNYDLFSLSAVERHDTTNVVSANYNICILCLFLLKEQWAMSITSLQDNPCAADMYSLYKGLTTAQFSVP